MLSAIKNKINNVKTDSKNESDRISDNIYNINYSKPGRVIIFNNKHFDNL